MKKIKKNKFKIKASIALILIIIVLYISINIVVHKNPLLIEENLKDYTLKINKNIIKSIDKNINKKCQQTENKIITETREISLEQEISELKKILELNTSLTEFIPINATVISRSNDYWFNTITIDKGKNENIEVGMGVITNDGLIGKIIKTTKETSEVKLLTTDDPTYKISVVIRINNKEHYAILNGYDETKEFLKLTAIDKNTSISKGDVVLTSGLGQIPKGIYVGTVEKTEIDQYNLGKIVYIKPKQDYNDIHYVTILKVKHK